jgi:hypothetical protein
LNTTQEKINAVRNLRATEAEVEQINRDYEQGLSHFRSRIYWWAILSPEEKKKRMTGGEETQPEEPRIKAKQYFVNGSVVPDDDDDDDEDEYRRRKRQTEQPIRPECVNLPKNINWVEKGNTGPVQNQLGCGKDTST